MINWGMTMLYISRASFPTSSDIEINVFRSPVPGKVCQGKGLG